MMLMWADVMYLLHHVFDYRYYCSLGIRNATTDEILNNWEDVLKSVAKYRVPAPYDPIWLGLLYPSCNLLSECPL